MEARLGQRLRITTRSLYSFQGNYNDGAQPLAGLVALNGAFYGTTYGGGGYHNPGTVFQITKGGKERALFDFSYSGKNGSKPTSGLIALNGTLYGTADGGGCCGVVYDIDFRPTKRHLRVPGKT